MKCGFSADHDGSNDDSVLKLTADNDDDWHSLQPLGAQSDYYSTCDSALKVYGV
jgi:hypothetical protein